MQEIVRIEDLGHIDYKEAWDYQTLLHKKLIEVKLANRERSEEDKIFPVHHLLICEHPPVYTLGKSGLESNLLLNSQELEQEEFSYYKINRGGDITYHGPGQVVVYPIFDLDRFYTDVHKYVRMLEQIVIDTLLDYKIVGDRIEGLTGVWLRTEDPRPNRKLCAIGVHLSRWVTMHGLALNVNTDLSHFNNIIPCGIEDKDKVVTSMAAELGQRIDLEEIKEKLKLNFAKNFGFEIQE
jgi:lipoyl(octanoyl) transferase